MSMTETAKPTQLMMFDLPVPETPVDIAPPCEDDIPQAFDVKPRRSRPSARGLIAAAGLADGVEPKARRSRKRRR